MQIIAKIVLAQDQNCYLWLVFQKVSAIHPDGVSHLHFFTVTLDEGMLFNKMLACKWCPYLTHQEGFQRVTLLSGQFWRTPPAALKGGHCYPPANCEMSEGWLVSHVCLPPSHLLIGKLNKFLILQTVVQGYSLFPWPYTFPPFFSFFLSPILGIKCFYCWNCHIVCDLDNGSTVSCGVFNY